MPASGLTLRSVPSVTSTASCAVSVAPSADAAPGTRTTPTPSNAASVMPVQSHVTGTSNAFSDAPTRAGTTDGAAACTPASDEPAATVMETGSVAVRPPTSTSAVTATCCPNTSDAVPGTSTRPVSAHAPSSGSCHVAATGTPAPHA